MLTFRDLVATADSCEWELTSTAANESESESERIGQKRLNIYKKYNMFFFYENWC